MLIEFTVPAVPVAQPRPKATSIGGKPRMYEAASSHPIHTFKASVQMAFMQAYQGPPLTVPVFMDVCFVFPRGSNKIWKSKPMERYPKSTKPDADNLVKGVLDALNKLAFADDGQVWSVSVTKWHAAGDEQPHVSVVLMT